MINMSHGAKKVSNRTKEMFYKDFSRSLRLMDMCRLSSEPELCQEQNMMEDFLEIFVDAELCRGPSDTWDSFILGSAMVKAVVAIDRFYK